MNFKRAVRIVALVLNNTEKTSIKTLQISGLSTYYIAVVDLRLVRIVCVHPPSSMDYKFCCHIFRDNFVTFRCFIIIRGKNYSFSYFRNSTRFLTAAV